MTMQLFVLISIQKLNEAFFRNVFVSCCHGVAATSADNFFFRVHGAIDVVNVVNLIEQGKKAVKKLRRRGGIRVRLDWHHKLYSTESHSQDERNQRIGA